MDQSKVDAVTGPNSEPQKAGEIPEFWIFLLLLHQKLQLHGRTTNITSEEKIIDL